MAASDEMIDVGIIGLGPVWESRYRPVLKKLRQRINVCAVYDPVASLAEQVAAEFQATPFQGVVSLLSRDEIRAILLLDSAWRGNELLRIVAAAGKPVYIVGPPGDDAAGLRRLHESAAAEGRTLVPELGRRHTPATGRLQELMATHIGRPQRIVIEAVSHQSVDAVVAARPAAERKFLIDLFDWCCYIVRTPVRSILSQQLDSAERGESRYRSITIEFEHSRSGGNRPVAELRVRSGPAQRSGDFEPQRRVADQSQSLGLCVHDVECERGQATIKTRTEIAWSTGGDVITESLTAERPEVEVMLDHFCRRIVGGLIPVADLGDVSRGVSLVAAAEESLLVGKAISLNGRE